MEFQHNYELVLHHLKPGPMLPMQAIEAPIAVLKSNPKLAIKTAPNMKMIKYSRKKESTLKNNVIRNCLIVQFNRDNCRRVNQFFKFENAIFKND